MKFSALALLAAAFPQAAVSQEVASLHGSGTTNPSKCYWHIMDELQTQLKIPARLTYRAIGSSGGQEEFIGDTGGEVPVPYNDFGSGDIPLDQDDFDLFQEGTILHLPIVLGAISFFHSVPTGDKELRLTPCLLAKIFDREITDWTDEQIKEVNPDLDLPGPFPIRVARRVNGSSSTKSITSYLHQTCPDYWPETLVDKEIAWKTDTLGCEGSAGMTACINEERGTIGYIDSGHGHAQGLQEIKLKNADGNYISSKESAERDGIMAATESAGLPEQLDGSFANVNLLNRDGASTWPIVAMSYVYVRKDLDSYMGDRPTAQGLLQAFLKALYTDQYIETCVDDFSFFRVSGSLRDKALTAIENLNMSAQAPRFTFEFDTIKGGGGQLDDVISVKRASYSEIEQDNLVSAIKALQLEVESLKEKNTVLEAEVVALTEGTGMDDDEEDNDTQIRVAMAFGTISFIMWVLAIIVLLVRFVLNV